MNLVQKENSRTDFVSSQVDPLSELTFKEFTSSKLEHLRKLHHQKEMASNLNSGAF